VKTSRESVTESPSYPGPDGDLRLFGQGDGAQEVSFHGLAASSFRQHTDDGEGADFDPSMDPTGKKIVFASTRHSPESHLYIKPADGAVLTQITDAHANDAQPVFSPDGMSIAFASDRGGQWDIWIVDADGRNPRQITSHRLPELHPSWSPDGRRLVFCRVNPRVGGGELWMAEIDSPGVRQLIGEGLFPSWSPMGTKIVFQKARARGSRWFSIWTLEWRDGEALFPTEIASSPDAALIAPCWSPDGTQIAFTQVFTNDAASDGATGPGVSGQGRADIATVDVDGRGMLRLTNGGGQNYSPAWSIDGRIYFTAKRQDTESIWSLRPAGRSDLPIEESGGTSGRQAAFRPEPSAP